MTTYSIIPQTGGTEFSVEIVDTNGARQTMLGFATEADAEAWIAVNRARDRFAEAPALQSLP